MTRFVLKFKELCVLTTILAVGGLVLLISVFGSSSWSSVFGDLPEEEIHKLGSVNFVAEYPVKDSTIDLLRLGKASNIKTFEIKVKTSGINGRTEVPFDQQVVEGFANLQVPLPYDLSKKQYAFYIDIPRRLVDKFQNAYLYYYLVMDDYRLYVNGSLKRVVDSLRGDLGAVQLIDTHNSDFIRVLWVCENDKKTSVMGLFYKYGLSLRSEQSIVDTIEAVRYKTYFPHIVSSSCFLIIAIIALGFAFSTRGFLDIWAFAAFSMAMGLFIWAQTPVFYWSWGWDDGGKLLGSIRGCLAAIVIILACILTMSFFRLEGRHMRINDIVTFFRQQSLSGILRQATDTLNHPFRMTLIATIVVSAVILYKFWPFSYKGEIRPNIQINSRLAYVLFFSQCMAFFFGYRSLFRIRRKFVEKGLEAQVKLIHRRFYTSLVFTAGMGLMNVVFLFTLKGVTDLYETDLWLVSAIAPASAMLLMFFWMVSSANRFYQRFAPRLGQIDHEVLAFGRKALQTRYFGCLLVFDLKGMKKLNLVRSKSKKCEEAVDRLLRNVERNLSDLIQTGRITFKYKSNGDEFIFNMRAKDEAEATKLMIELTSLWQKCAEKYLAYWREQLTSDLADELSRERIEELCASLEIHVLITTLRDMKITVKGGIEKPTANPDFIDPRFTHLTTLFKPTRHNKIAMYQDDAEAYLAKVPSEARFNVDHDDLGFLEFPGEEIERKAS